MVAEAKMAAAIQRQTQPCTNFGSRSRELRIPQTIGAESAATPLRQDAGQPQPDPSDASSQQTSRKKARRKRRAECPTGVATPRDAAAVPRPVEQSGCCPLRKALGTTAAQ